MRKCIKCERELPLGMFRDNWRHKVNVCNSCIRAKKREYDKLYKARKTRYGKNVPTVRMKNNELIIFLFELLGKEPDQNDYKIIRREFRLRGIDIP